MGMIKAKKDFILYKMIDDYMIIAVGDSSNSFRAILKTNETGAFYWQMLKEGTTREEMLRAALNRYEDLDENIAMQDIDEFLENVAPAIEFD